MDDHSSPVIDAAGELDMNGEMLAALRRGDEQAFRDLVSEHETGLRRVASVYVPDAFVDEVVQETWVAVVNGLDRFQGHSTLSTWIYRILINLARRRGQRESRMVPIPVDATEDTYLGAVNPNRLNHPDLGQGYWPAAPDWERNPEDAALTEEIMALIRATLAGLSLAQREVMTLRDVEGFSAREVCEMLLISEVNQRTLLHRARVVVRRRLEVYLNG
jgi:RNA polymerase sigma-70 factor, ECF subfamily